MCGIAGAMNVPRAAFHVHLMIQQQQHRGQKAAGIAALDMADGAPRMRVHTGLGWVRDAFRDIDLDRDLPGDMAIGHVRYPTSGASADLSNAQPLVQHIEGLPYALVHNGNLTNLQTLRDLLDDGRSDHRPHDSDSALFLRLLARTDPKLSTQTRLHLTTRQTQGAYSLLLLAQDGVHAAVDAHGFRPLVACDYKGGMLFASEECAFRPFPESTNLRHLRRHSLFAAHRNGYRETLLLPGHTHGRACSFETLYFSKPESRGPDGRSNQSVREALGRALAAKERHIPFPDVVTPVPDSSNAMALAYAMAIGAPFAFALIRSHETGRTFIRSKQADRDLATRMKYNVVHDAVQGKRVVLVDDSIVRGTTMRRLVRLLRESGASEVHVRSGSPRVVHPCFWGIDTPNLHELIANIGSNEAVRQAIGADSLEYLTLDEFMAELGDRRGEHHCVTCFSGIPPTNDPLPPEHLVRRP
jgi:amidophosphoribosyltransferase